MSPVGQNFEAPGSGTTLIWWHECHVTNLPVTMLVDMNWTSNYYSGTSLEKPPKKQDKVVSIEMWSPNQVHTYANFWECQRVAKRANAKIWLKTNWLKTNNMQPKIFVFFQSLNPFITDGPRLHPVRPGRHFWTVGAKFECLCAHILSDFHVYFQ